MYISEFTVGFIVGAIVGIAVLIGIALLYDWHDKHKED